MLESTPIFYACPNDNIQRAIKGAESGAHLLPKNMCIPVLYLYNASVIVTLVPPASAAHSSSPALGCCAPRMFLLASRPLPRRRSLHRPPSSLMPTHMCPYGLLALPLALKEPARSGVLVDVSMVAFVGDAQLQRDSNFHRLAFALPAQRLRSCVYASSVAGMAADA